MDRKQTHKDSNTNMDFSKLETEVRDAIEQNKIKEALEALGQSLKDSSVRDEISLLLGTYNSVAEKTRLNTISPLDADIAQSTLRANILRILGAQKDYFKYKNQTFGAAAEADPAPNGLIEVFFSVGNPHNDQQQKYVDALKTYFVNHGIKLETLKNWNDEDPLLAILSALKKSRGCLVLALERYFVKEGALKRGSDQESMVREQAYSSPWLQIEAALARSLDLPLIILKDDDIQSDGLIHTDKQEWGIVRINHRDTEEIDRYPVKNFMLNWIKQVKSYEKERREG